MKAQPPEGDAATAAARGGSERRLAILLVAAAVAAAVLLRLWGLGSRPLWLDEAYSRWFSGLGWRDLWFDTPRYEPHPPFYYSLLKLWRLVAGEDAAALRGLSLLAGVATVPLVALAASELARLTRSTRPFQLVAFAAALAALSPRLLVVAQDARPYALLIFAYALAIWVWLRLANGFRVRPGAPGAAKDWLLLGAGTALTLWLHGIGILHAAALLAALLAVAAPAASRARWRRLALTVAMVTFVYLPCVLILAGRSGDWASGWLKWEPARFPGFLLDLVSLHEFDEWVTPVAARILIVILLFVAIRALLRAGDRPVAAGLALLLLLPPLAAALISQLGTPVFLPRTLAAMLVPAYLLLAFAIAGLPRGRMVMAAALLGALFLVNLTEAIRRPPMEEWGEIARVLRRELGPRDTIWVYPNDMQLPLELALGKAARIRAIPAPYPALSVKGGHPSGSPAVVSVDAAAARDWASRNHPDPLGTVWLVRGAPGLFDPGEQVFRALAAGRRIGPRRDWHNLTLQPLYPARDADVPAGPAGGG